MNPLISVIVPAYKVEKYICSCLDSILAQDYNNIEIIVIDDGTPDHSGEIADSYMKRYPGKIKSIHTENHGVSSARFTGVRHASGEWIGFVDGDDTIEPDFYSRLIQNALLEDADISHSGYRTIVNEGERIHYFHNTGKKVIQDRKQGLFDLISGNLVEPGLWNKLFKKNLLDQLIQQDSMDFSFKINEDLYLNFLLFSLSKKAVFEDFCSYNYMSRNTSVTRTSFSLVRVMDPIMVREKILSICPSYLKDLVSRKYLVMCYTGYSQLHGKKEFCLESKEIRKKLLTNKKYWKVLTRNERIRMLVILYLPHVYHAIYSFYTKHIQKKVYE